MSGGVDPALRGGLVSALSGRLAKRGGMRTSFPQLHAGPLVLALGHVTTPEPITAAREWNEVTARLGLTPPPGAKVGG